METDDAKGLEKLKRVQEAAQALINSPAVVLVSEAIIDDDGVRSVDVTQAYIDELWNALVDALEEAKS